MASTLIHASQTISSVLLSSKTLTPRTPAVLVSRRSNCSHSFSLSHSNLALRFPGANSTRDSSRARHSICFYKAGDDKFQRKENDLDWPILRRWDVPWEWQTVSLTSLACGLSVDRAICFTVSRTSSWRTGLGWQSGNTFSG